jgi:hypothetical protein
VDVQSGCSYIVFVESSSCYDVHDVDDNNDDNNDDDDDDDDDDDGSGNDAKQERRRAMLINIRTDTPAIVTTYANE